jgi:hypothetical protein
MALRVDEEPGRCLSVSSIGRQTRKPTTRQILPCIKVPFTAQTVAVCSSASDLYPGILADSEFDTIVMAFKHGVNCLELNLETNYQSFGLSMVALLF